MTVKEIEREIVKNPDIDPKKEFPKKYGVVFRSEGLFCTCGVNVLCDVFKMSASEAYDTNIYAALVGDPMTVFVGDQDTASTKAQAAEEERRLHGSHNSMINYLSFKCEPLT